jgi:hypothetical protein
MTDMLTMDKVTDAVQGLGFERIEHIPGSTFRDNSTIIVIPTRGMIHHKVVQAWQNLMAPMNQKRGIMFASGHEVGRAYDELVERILVDPVLSKWQYMLTLEDDNLPLPDAHIRLLESIAWGDFDAVSGLYWTKGDYNMPMAYGDPEHYNRTGELEFKPRDVRQALTRGTLMPVNGIAMGCALWKLDLFRRIPKPWFQTLSDWTPEKGGECGTQDLVFCGKAKRAGARFAVDMRVKVGHLDINTGIVY